MSKLDPKWQYFVWLPLFSSTALTLLGIEFTRASQVATEVLFYFSMTTSRSWWMLETLCSSTFHLRMPHRCSIGFRSGDMLEQSITFTLSLPFTLTFTLARWPSLQREGIVLCFSMSQYMLAFMVPSMNCSSTVPAALMLDSRHDTLLFVPLTLFPPHTLHTEPNKFILVSSDHMT